MSINNENRVSSIACPPKSRRRRKHPISSHETRETSDDQHRVSSIEHRESSIQDRESVLSPLHLSRELYKSTLFMQNKAKLQIAEMNISSYITKAYENLYTFCSRKNKAKQTQNKPKLQNAKMNVIPLLTKEYENILTFCRNENKPKQSQNKPNFEPKLASFFPILALFFPNEPNFKPNSVKMGNLECEILSECFYTSYSIFSVLRSLGEEGSPILALFSPILALFLTNDYL